MLGQTVHELAVDNFVSVGVNSDAFQSFTWKCFIPLMKIVHACDREMLNQVKL